MTIDFTRDKIELTADIEQRAILIVAKGKKRKVARFRPDQIGQIPRDMVLLYAKLFAMANKK